MSVLDLSSLLQVTAPEVLAPPDPPATPAIDNSTASTADSTSSGSSSSSDTSTLRSLTQQQTGNSAKAAPTSIAATVNQWTAAAEEAAAALVDVGGASSITVDDYETSVPPNLAAASALLSELSANSNANSGVLSAAFVALSADDALSLTAA